MTEALNLKIKTCGGEITTLNVAELIEVDGRAYVPPMEQEDYLEALHLIAGRLDRIETVVCREEAVPEEE